MGKSIQRRHRKKSFKRRSLAWLGIRHPSKKYIFFYVLTLIILFFMLPFIIRVLTAFKDNYGKSQGYAPRDYERFERLNEKGKAIPFQPGGSWQYDKD